MSDRPQRAAPIPITAAMRAAFRRDAPAALARRNDAYLLGIAINVAQWLAIGGIGLFGLHAWGWSAGQMLLVFVAGIVAAILADALKWIFARRTMRAQYATMERDRLVWAMRDAQARGADEIAADRLQPKSPGPLLLIDLLVGSVGTWLLWGQLADLGLDPRRLADWAPSLQLALAIVLLLPLLSMLAAALAHQRSEGGYDDLEFRAGGRGIGLLLLAAALAFFGDGEAAARGMMNFVNWATVVAGLLSIGGVAVMRHERNSLREALAAPDAAPHASPRGKRRRARDDPPPGQ
jgi:hypothetical protein